MCSRSLVRGTFTCVMLQRSLLTKESSVNWSSPTYASTRQGGTPGERIKVFPVFWPRFVFPRIQNSLINSASWAKEPPRWQAERLSLEVQRDPDALIPSIEIRFRQGHQKPHRESHHEKVTNTQGQGLAAHGEDYLGKTWVYDWKALGIQGPWQATVLKESSCA